MKMRMKGILVLLCVILTCGAQKLKQHNSKSAHQELHNGKPCSNLTQIMDNWKFAIMKQVKHLLINNHASVLPEYTKIPLMSDNLRKLYKEVDMLKDELRVLGTKFDYVETIVDDIKDSDLRRQSVGRIHPGMVARHQAQNWAQGINRRPNWVRGPGRSLRRT